MAEHDPFVIAGPARPPGVRKRPDGAARARIIVTLTVHQQRDLRRKIATVSIVGGEATAIAMERG